MRDLSRLLVCLCSSTAAAWAQGAFEVQVYGSESTPPRVTVLETHSNFTLRGTKTVEGGVLPTHRAFHETIEITHGFTDWYETGFYIFTSHQPQRGWMWVGDHIRPRFTVPERFGLPVGLSLSVEVGYQRPAFSADTWTCEIRPIVDKKLGRWYASFNPTLDRSFHGPESTRGFQFSPNVKLSYDVTKRVSGGIEYYGSLGPITGFDRLRDQQQQILPAIDLNLSEKWEVNFGAGIGMTRSTDHLLIKVIIGRRFKRGSRPAKAGRSRPSDTAPRGRRS